MQSDTSDTAINRTFFMTDYEKLTDLNYLSAAFNKSKKDCAWKDSVQKVEFSNFFYLSEIQEKLKTNTYHPYPTNQFILSERGKTRLIKALDIRDRIVLHVLCDEIINKKMDKYLIYDNGASQVGKGMAFTRRRLSTHLSKYYQKYKTWENGYILQIDFSKFFDNIQHDKIKEIINRIIDDDRVKQLIFEYIDMFNIDVSYMTDEEYQEAKNGLINCLEMPSDNRGEKFLHKSVGIGSQISQSIGILFPTEIDNYVKIVRHQKLYGRYMDDSYIISNNKPELQDILENIRRIASDLGLHINDKKTHIIPLKHGFTFLKIRYKLLPNGKIIKGINKSSLKRERRRIRTLMANASIPLKDVYNCYYSWRQAKLKECNCYKTIKSMDDYYRSMYERYRKAAVED